MRISYPPQPAYPPFSPTARRQKRARGRAAPRAPTAAAAAAAADGPCRRPYGRLAAADNFGRLRQRRRGTASRRSRRPALGSLRDPHGTVTGVTGAITVAVVSGAGRGGPGRGRREPRWRRAATCATPSSPPTYRQHPCCACRPAACRGRRPDACGRASRDAGATKRDRGDRRQVYNLLQGRYSNCNGKQLCGTCIVDVVSGAQAVARFPTQLPLFFLCLVVAGWDVIMPPCACRTPLTTTLHSSVTAEHEQQVPRRGELPPPHAGDLPVSAAGASARASAGE